jgi:hypothetical protein
MPAQVVSREVDVPAAEYDGLREAIKTAVSALKGWTSHVVRQVAAERPGLLKALDTIDDCLGTTTLKQTQRADTLRKALKDVSDALYFECEWAAERGANVT